MDTLDRKKGIALAQEGIARADANAREDWRIAFDAAIYTVARFLERFTADSVWVLLDHWGIPRPHKMGFDARAATGRFNAAVKAGVIQRSEGLDARSARPDTHSSHQRYYYSLCYDQPSFFSDLDLIRLMKRYYRWNLVLYRTYQGLREVEKRGLPDNAKLEKGEN